MPKQQILSSDMESDSDTDGVPLQVQTANTNGKRKLDSESDLSDDDNDGAPLVSWDSDCHRRLRNWRICRVGLLSLSKLCGGGIEH